MVGSEGAIELCGSSEFRNHDAPWCCLPAVLKGGRVIADWPGVGEAECMRDETLRRLPTYVQCSRDYCATT
jgi:hypothetical protein